MRTRLHLISPPWSPPHSPSPQLGTLKAWVDREMSGQVETRSYSAFLEILYRVRESACNFFHKDFHFVGEEIYTLIYNSRYPRSDYALKKGEIRDYVKSLDTFLSYYRASQSGPLTGRYLAALENHTLAYVREKIVSELIDDGVNVVGFTMNYKQVYASLVMSRMIQELAPDKKVIFLYGGFSAALPSTFELMSKLKIPGYIVFGEGEHRVVEILKKVTEQETLDAINGVFRIGDPVDLENRDETLFRSQIKDLNFLPDPDYDEYFSLHRGLCKDDPIFERLLRPYIPIEGSRGCFAACDFCNLNFGWSGFRKFEARTVYDRVRSLMKRYQMDLIFFIDNVCDTWAEKFAEQVLRDEIRVQYFMSLRAHHPESFWAKLALSGMDRCQIGIEALSAPLLRHMSKGTLLIQNLRVLKSFEEMGVMSCSGIITHHPKATRKDAQETLRVLQHVSHLDPVEPRRFELGIGSPLHQEMEFDHKKWLDPAEGGKGPQRWVHPMVGGKPPKKLLHYMASSGSEVPEEYQLSDANTEAWSKVTKVARVQVWTKREDRPEFSVQREAGGKLRIRDTRFKPREIVLDQLDARIFDVCHEGLKMQTLEKKLGLAREVFQSALDGLVSRKLILAADDYYITLAVRPRVECLERLGLLSSPSDLRLEQSLAL